MSDDELTDDFVAKGLRAGSVSLLGSVVIGVAAVAPAYTATASVGPAAASVGLHLPAVILLGALPMLLTALGYRELNRAMPDAGTSFTWVAVAFGPRMGWMAGWVLAVAMALGFCNAASFGADYIFVALSQVLQMPQIAAIGQLQWVNLLVCLMIVCACGWVAYRGMSTTQTVQHVLVGVQLVVLALFLVRAFMAGGRGHEVALAWFNPMAALPISGLATGLSMAAFMFWGWETTLTLNEETEGAHRTPGLAAWLTVGSTVVLYLLIAVACIRFAGVGVTGLGLGNPAVRSNIFIPLAQPVLGPFAVCLSIAIVFSAVACVQSTIACPTRTLLAMGVYRAVPQVLGKISRHSTPGVAILVSTFGSWAIYAAISCASQNALTDTVAALAMLVSFYLSLTALACVWYFRDEWFSSVSAFCLRLTAPLAGGLSLAWLFFKMIRDSLDPAYGSGSHIGSIGLVAIMGAGLIALGVIIMMITNFMMPAYFRGHTLGLHSHADRGQ